MPARLKSNERVVVYVPREEIKPNPWNRTVFDPEALQELAKSIRAEGIREPLIVRVKAAGGYEIASGNRRWLAAKMIGLEKLPCLIETLSDEQVAEDNIVMNIQREDIPPLELARMVQAYMKTFNKTQADASRTFGKSRAWVSQLLSFLKMAPAPALKVFTMVNTTWHQLRAINTLDTDLASIIAKELEDGSLTPRRIIKRCNQFLYGRHHKKGGFSKAEAPPPDSLKKEWENVRSEVVKASTVWWEVRHGEQTLPGGQKHESWYFSAAPTSGDARQALADWFTSMGKALAGRKIEPESENEYLRSVAQTKQMEQNAMKLLGARLPADRRVPKTAAEKAELSRISATEGPRGVYRWIYGKDSPMAAAVPVDSWEAIGTTPEAGLKDILAGL